MNPCKPFLQKKIPPLYNEEEDPPKTHLTPDGLEGRSSLIIYHQEVVEVVEVAAVEETVVEEAVAEKAVAETQETRMTEDLDQS